MRNRAIIILYIYVYEYKDQPVFELLPVPRGKLVGSVGVSICLQRISVRNASVMDILKRVWYTRYTCVKWVCACGYKIYIYTSRHVIGIWSRDFPGGRRDGREKRHRKTSGTVSMHNNII